jgi:putative acetyltransferase
MPISDLPETNTGLSIRPESPDQGTIACMLQESDAVYAALYPPEDNHLMAPDALSGPTVTFLVARCDGVIAGFGALALRGGAGNGGGGGEPAYGEVKRMYVSPAMRGMGLGRRLVEALQDVARAQNLTTLRLETGNLQPEALGLYRAMGFQERAPFGDYAPSDVSLYFEKKL